MYMYLGFINITFVMPHRVQEREKDHNNHNDDAVNISESKSI